MMKLFRTTDDTTTDDETAHDEGADPAMSQEPTAPAADTRPAAPGLARESDAAAEPATTYGDAGITSDQPQPTFTPALATSADSTVTSVRPDPTDGGGDFTRPVSAVAPASGELPAYDETPAYGEPTTFPASASAATPPLDEPLLDNSAGRRASWQKVQAEFVDDPQAAVLGAAGLIEQTARSLADALQERQRQLRDAVTGDSAGSGSAPASGTPDTEHLRLMMQRYRTLFDQLCKA